jgi:hypothetical protein
MERLTDYIGGGGMREPFLPKGDDFKDALIIIS